MGDELHDAKIRVLMLAIAAKDVVGCDDGVAKVLINIVLGSVVLDL